MPEPETTEEKTGDNAGTTVPENDTGLPGSPGNPDPDSPAQENGERARRIAYFIGLLSDDNEGTRWRAAEALGRISDPAAVGPLIDTLWDDDARVRQKAAWALGAIGDMRAVPALRRLYRIEREEARDIIREALDAIVQRAAGSG